jgi:peptide deformylase
VKANNLNGEDIRLDLSGLEARVFQHEYDHLDGILFHDRMSPEVYKRIKPQLEKLEREYKDGNSRLKR